MIIWKRNIQNDELTKLRNEKKYWNKQYCEQAEKIESLRNQLELKSKQYENLLYRYLKLTNGKEE